MKKLIAAFALALTTMIPAFAGDLSTVWSQYQDNKGFIIADVDADKAAKNGFETLTVALNSAPTSQQINDIKRLAATIDESQKLTSVQQQGVEVTVYAAPAAADGSLYKLMIVIDKNDTADKMLVVLYGTCTKDSFVNALQNLSIEDIIGS